MFYMNCYFYFSENWMQNLPYDADTHETKVGTKPARLMSKFFRMPQCSRFVLRF